MLARALITVRPCARRHRRFCQTGIAHASTGGEEGSESEGVRVAQRERKEWAASVRARSKRVTQRAWRERWRGLPPLDPPPALADVSVVLVEPKFASNIGSVARAMSSFEATDLRIVRPRADHLTRASTAAAAGAQYLLYSANLCETLEEALEDCSACVAFARWTDAGDDVKRFRSLHSLCEWLEQTRRGSDRGNGRVALVFGREEDGLYEDEIELIKNVSSIPVGRLQESLSLAHAVSVVLARLYENRIVLAEDESGDSEK
mmetsp:Transcript_15750/g.51660  ORF Transcript_15750/g.51660 Transcript_15750/m.51660 type:complete len:262 (+) Transcript_15750:326-1111(+)